MRLPQLHHDALSPEQQKLYADMKSGIETSFKGSRRSTGTAISSAPGIHG